MRLTMGVFVLGIGFCTAVPQQVLGAGNPTIDVLSQGSVVEFTGKEAVSEPFSSDVTIATNDKGLNLTLAVGQRIALSVGPGRILGGMIERIEQVDGPGSQGLYRLRIVPVMQRLQYRTASRTFYGKTIVDVAAQLLNESGFTQVEVRIAGALPVEEMLVQYQESDFAFVSRLLEGAGIHYHFEVSPTGEKLVLSDGNAGFPISAVGKVAFGQTPTPGIVSFVRGQALHAGQVQAGDYNWRTPGADISAVAQAAMFGDLTERVFPAGIETKPEAQAAASVRLAARISGAQSCSGESTYLQLQAGTRVFLTGHPRADFNQEYVITAVEHKRTGKEYRNTFRCLPVQVVYRPQLLTPAPVVTGVVSGVVVGPSGETRHVDQFERVKIRFPWRSPAHSNPNDPGDVGFVRVAQIAAGAGAAAMWLPDVGDEVLVAFEHGDPRRPVVIGSVYNTKDMPPVALPANKHLSIFRQQGPGGVNEFVFDGTPGKEKLVVQGTSVIVTSGGDLLQRAGRSLVMDTGADLSIKTAQNLSIVSQGNGALMVAGNSQFTTGGDAQWSVAKNLQSSIGSSAVMDIAKDLTIRAGQNYLLQVQRMVRVTAGDDTVIQSSKSLVANVGGMFQFVAAQTGTIQAARGLLLRSDGDIDIIGKDIDAKASGNLTLKGSKITQN